MQTTLRCRPLRSADASVLSAWLDKDLEGTGKSVAARAEAIGSLILEERLRGAIFEKYDLDAEVWQPQSIGVSGFVHPEIINAHLAGPEPFLFHKVLGLATVGKARHFMDPDEQTLGNSAVGAGLDLLAHWMQRSWNVDDPLWRPIYLMAHENFIKEHRGFRLNRMLHEDWTRTVDIYLAIGYRAHSTFEVRGNTAPAFGVADCSSRTLYYMDRQEILTQAPGSAASYLLQFVNPVCGFSRAEQRLLRHALEGLTDHQLAATLELSINTLKSMWRSIYDRVEMHASFAFSGLKLYDQEARGRGNEKRRGVLAFIEAHPQEIRPYRKA